MRRERVPGRPLPGPRPPKRQRLPQNLRLARPSRPGRRRPSENLSPRGRVTESDAGVIEAPSAALEVAIESVRQAAAVCRAVRQSFRPELATSKADQSPVTVADYASQALISLALAEAFPTDPIVGEESSAGLRGDAGSPLAASVLEAVRTVRADVGLDEICAALDRCSDPGGATGRRWTVDPVDGTKGFLRNQQYAVALALIED